MRFETFILQVHSFVKQKNRWKKEDEKLKGNLARNI